jgi:hypothetical protein
VSAATETSGSPALHGLLGHAPIATAFEQQADWEAHLAAYRDCLDPLDHPEHVLAEHIAFLYWRRARLALYESAAIAAQLQAFEDGLHDQPATTGAPVPDATVRALDHATANPQTKPLSAEQIAARRGLCLLPDPKTMDRIMRYSAQISKDIERTTVRLDQLRATRSKRRHALLSRGADAARRPNLDPDFVLAAIMVEDPRSGRHTRLADSPLAVCHDDRLLAASAPAAPSANTGCTAAGSESLAIGEAYSSAAAESALSKPPLAPVVRRATARATKQSQTCPRADRPAQGRHPAKHARRRGK